MQFQKATIIRSADKQGITTPRSEYIFHLSAYPAQDSFGFYEGRYANTSLEYNVHYHKKMTEVFTVLEGEFSFMLGEEEHVFYPGDTAIIPPVTLHGFKPLKAGSRLQFMFTGTGSREDFFTGLEKIVTGKLDLNAEEREAFFNSHDQYFI
jgi:mannose-6-phosphate isomerase-like protein (cupin superfamily)